MMRSMYSGVSGLQAHQLKMDVIGNNIANVNTVGYKSQRVTFNEVFSQTLQGGTSASDETGRGGRNPMQVGLGVNVSSIDMLMTQGAAQRTDNPFDLMIGGDGFIIAGDDSGKYFTRAGALRQDDEGNLVIPNGMKVQGWQPTEDGKGIVKGEVGDIKLNDPKNVSTPPSATTGISLGGNLDIKDSRIPRQMKMYDSLGNAYSMTVNLVYTAGNGGAGTWHVETPLEGVATPPVPPVTTPTPPDPALPGTHIILTDSTGKKVAIEAPALTPGPPPTGGGIFGGTPLTFDASGKLQTGGPFTTPAIDLTLATTVDPATGLPTPSNATIGTGGVVTVDVSGVTQYASKTNAEMKATNGGPAGQMTGFDVGGDGKITAYYNNGATKLLGQIVVAEFDNPAGLEKVGDNLFKTTANSGDFDSIGKEGIFQAGVLEMSNVDLSKEFTEMIVTQRGFQANSRIISVSDEMLQELVNIKR